MDSHSLPCKDVATKVGPICTPFSFPVPQCRAQLAAPSSMVASVGSLRIEARPLRRRALQPWPLQMCPARGEATPSQHYGGGSSRAFNREQGSTALATMALEAEEQRDQLVPCLVVIHGIEHLLIQGIAAILAVLPTSASKPPRWT
jgi:hypothetical protein